MNMNLFPPTLRDSDYYCRVDALKWDKPMPAVPFLWMSPEVELLATPVGPDLSMRSVIDDNEPKVAK